MEGHSNIQDQTNLKHCKMNLPSWKDGPFHIGVDTLPTAFNPVVVLKKLSLTTVKQYEGFNQPLMNKANIILPVKAATDCQPNTWYDENQSLSDISVSDIELSDGDELIHTLTNKESIKLAERKKHSDQTKDSNNTDVKLTCHSWPVDAIRTREKKESQKIVEAVVQIENKKTEVEKEVKVSLSRLDIEVMSSSEEESVKNSSNAKQDLSKNVPDNTKLHFEAKDKDYLKDTTKPDLKDKNKFDCKDGGKVESKDGAKVELKDGVKVELKDEAKVELKDGAKVELKDGAKVELKDGAKVELKDGAKVELKDGAKVELKDGTKLELTKLGKKDSHNVTREKDCERVKSTFETPRKTKRQHSADTDTSRIKQSKVEVPGLFLPSVKETQKINKNFSPNTRYKLDLNMITISDLGNEAFRKFLNLASDCALQFTKKKNPNSLHGSVSLYFGDASSLQMSLQKLSLLPTLAGNACIRGIIKCMEIKTEEQHSDQPKYSLLDRKNEGTKKKSAQVHRIHSAMNQEMLILLFPFSLNVHISEVDHPMKGVKGPVDVEFENQDWMEAVLTCFQDFVFIPSGQHAKPFYLKIDNFTPPTNKSFNKPSQQQELQQKKRQEFSGNIPNDSAKGNKIGQDKRSNNSHDSMPRKRPERRHETTDQKKGIHDMGGNKSKQSQQDKVWLVPASSDPSKVDLYQLAVSRGLDPNNKDVIKILEMSVQLEALQAAQLGVESVLRLRSDEVKSHQEVISQTGFSDLDYSQAEKSLKENIAIKMKLLEELEEKFRGKSGGKQNAIVLATKAGFGAGSRSPSRRKHPSSDHSRSRSSSHSRGSDRKYRKKDDGRHDLDYTAMEDTFDPTRNDAPLDFSKPTSLVSTEQAVTQDYVRTLQVLQEMKPAYIVKEDKCQSVEEMCLPVQFGKNALKKTPQELEQEKKQAVNKHKNSDFYRETRPRAAVSLNRDRGLDSVDTNRRHFNESTGRGLDSVDSNRRHLNEGTGRGFDSVDTNRRYLNEGTGTGLDSVDMNRRHLNEGTGRGLDSVDMNRRHLNEGTGSGFDSVDTNRRHLNEGTSRGLDSVDMNRRHLNEGTGRGLLRFNERSSEKSEFRATDKVSEMTARLKARNYQEDNLKADDYWNLKSTESNYPTAPDYDKFDETGHESWDTTSVQSFAKVNRSQLDSAGQSQSKINRGPSTFQPLDNHWEKRSTQFLASNQSIGTYKPSHDKADELFQFSNRQNESFNAVSRVKLNEFGSRQNESLYMPRAKCYEFGSGQNESLNTMSKAKANEFGSKQSDSLNTVPRAKASEFGNRQNFNRSNNGLLGERPNAFISGLPTEQSQQVRTSNLHGLQNRGIQNFGQLSAPTNCENKVSQKQNYVRSKQNYATLKEDMFTQEQDYTAQQDYEEQGNFFQESQSNVPQPRVKKTFHQPNRYNSFNDAALGRNIQVQPTALERNNIPMAAQGRNFLSTSAAPVRNINALSVATVNIHAPSAALGRNAYVPSPAPGRNIQALSAAPERNISALSAATSRNIQALSAAPGRNIQALSAAPGRNMPAMSPATVNIHALSTAPRRNIQDLSVAQGRNIQVLPAAPNRNTHALSAAPGRNIQSLSVAQGRNINAGQATQRINIQAQQMTIAGRIINGPLTSQRNSHIPSLFEVNDYVSSNQQVRHGY